MVRITEGREGGDNERWREKEGMTEMERERKRE